MTERPMAKWIKTLNVNHGTRVLFLAQYAPKPPLYESWPYSGDGGYPRYHAYVYHALKTIGCTVLSSTSPNALFTSANKIDYVYSLINRLPIRDSEVLVSAFCEYLGLPYLGAPPAVRALAQDKHLFKIFASGLGIEVPRGMLLRTTDTPPRDPPSLRPPFFVKARGGAASEGLTKSNLASTWSEAKEQGAKIHVRGEDALIEEFTPGIDITVPLIGGSPFHILDPVESLSDESGSILTHELKLEDRLGYQLINLSTGVQERINTDLSKLWNELGPLDYLRADYRFNRKTQSIKLLEINICCHLEKDSAIAMAAENQHIPVENLYSHILRYSLDRQASIAQDFEWVL